MKNTILPLAAAAVLGAGLANAQQYAFEILDVPGAVRTTPMGLNAAGEVVGFFEDGALDTHGFHYTPGTGFTTLDHPSGVDTSLYGVNDQGLAVGWRGLPDDEPFACRAGAFVDLPIPGHFGAYRAVSNTGLFVGSWSPFEVASHGVTYDGQSITTIDYPGAIFTQFQGVNGAGVIAGAYGILDPWEWHGLLYDTVSGTFAVLDKPGAAGTWLNGINSAREVVGYEYIAGTTLRRAVLHDTTTWTTLEIPGQIGDAEATGINDAGTICGYFDTSVLGVWRRRGFLARRIPGGPSSYCSTNPNSTGEAARLRWLGTTSVTANDFVLVAESGPAYRFGLFYYGATEIQVPFGDGFRCVGAPIFRFPPVAIDPFGFAFHELDVTRPPSPAGQITPGSTWRFQFWHRDPAAGGQGFNLSDALTVPFEE